MTSLLKRSELPETAPYSKLWRDLSGQFSLYPRSFLCEEVRVLRVLF
jgi:hypothetical protein